MTDIFVMSDAGRSKSKRSKQKNDCTVRAVVEVTGLPYDEVYYILKEAGRACGAGFDFKNWAPKAEVNGCSFKWKSFPAVCGQRRMNPVTFCKTFPSGKYIVKTAKHVFAIIDGKMYDTVPADDDRCIYGCYEVIKKEPAVETKKSMWPAKNSMPFAEQIAIIEKMANKEVLVELQYMLDVDCEVLEEDEEPYDLLCAFDDVYNQMESNKADCARSYVDNLQDIAIAIGWYREVSEEELSQTISSGGKNYDLKFRNKKYKFNGRGGE